MAHSDEVLTEVRALRADLEQRVFETARRIGERADMGEPESSLIWKAIGERYATSRVLSRLDRIEAQRTRTRGL